MKENKALVTVMGKEIEQIEYQGEAVVTLRMIDDLHKRPEGTARKTFNRNKDKFIEGTDYFDVPYSEWSSLSVCQTDVQDAENAHGGYKGQLAFIIKMGYLMLVKTFTDDLAWQVQRELVKNYFTTRSFTPSNASAWADYLDNMNNEVKAVGIIHKQQDVASTAAERIYCGQARLEDYDYVPETKKMIVKTMKDQAKDREEETRIAIEMAEQGESLNTIARQLYGAVSEARIKKVKAMLNNTELEPVTS